MLLTLILQTASAKRNLDQKPAEAGHLKSQVSERKLGLSNKVKPEVGPSNRQLPKTEVDRRGLFGLTMTQRVDRLSASLNGISDKAKREIAKLEGIADLSNQFLVEADKTSEATVVKEYTFADVCDTQRMTKMATTTRNFVVKYFDESFHYMAWNAFQIKVEIYYHWAEITRYTEVLKQYTNVVLKSYLQRYFTIRMQGLSAFLGALFNFEVDRESFTGTLYNFEQYFKSVQKMSYSVVGIALEYDNLFYFLDKWRGDKIFFKAADEVIDANNKLNGETIVDKADEFVTKSVERTLQLVCDTTVTLMNLYFTQRSEADFIKATQTNKASYNFVIEYLMNYMDMFAGVYNGAVEAIPGRRFTNCKDLSAKTVVYKTFASYYSMKMVAKDITDEAIFKSRKFFSRNYMLFLNEKLTHCQAFYGCDHLLFYPENSGKAKNPLDVLTKGKVCQPYAPDIEFLSDFSVILGWKTEWGTNYDFDSFFKLRACVKPNGDLDTTQDAKVCANAHIYQAYFLVLTNIYKGYNFARQFKKITTTKTGAEKLQEMYAAILNIFISAELGAYVTQGWILMSEMQLIYVDLIYYLCEKAGKHCQGLGEKSWDIPKGYLEKWKVRITKTTITTTTITTFDKIIETIRKTTITEDIRKLIMEFRFKYVKRECRGLVGKPENKDCKDIQGNYVEFTKILIQIFSLKDMDIFDYLIYYILDIKSCLIEGTAYPMEGCKQTASWYLWIFITEALKTSKPPIGKELLFRIYDIINIYFLNFVTDTEIPKTPKDTPRKPRVNYEQTLSFFEKLFGIGEYEFDAAAGRSKKLIKFSTEDLILVEQILYYVIYETALYSKDETYMVELTKRLVPVIRNMYIQVGYGDVVKADTFMVQWKKAMSMDKENIKPLVREAVLKQTGKNSMSLIEMITIKVRLITYVQAGEFFVLFPADSSFTKTENKPYSNPFTVVFNYFTMVRQEIDQEMYFVTDFISSFYQKVKDCMKKTSEGAPVGANDCYQLSHRKFAEIFFFVQALYLKNVPYYEPVKPEIRLTTYYDETKPIVHSKIFMSMFFQENVSELMKQIIDECDIARQQNSVNSKTAFANMNRMCADLFIYYKIYDHIKSEDVAGLNQKAFLEQLLDLLNGEFSDANLTKLKFTLMNSGEIMDYISISSLHLDRYYNIFDQSRIDKLPEITKGLGQKSLYQLTTAEISVFANYLYRMFGKLDYSSTEMPTHKAVKSLLELKVEEFKNFLKVSDVPNFSQFKTIFLYALPTQYQKIAELISSEDRFLQVVLMNNFNSETKNEKLLMFVKTLDPSSFVEVNKMKISKILKQPAYKDFSKVILDKDIDKDIEKYKSQLKRAFYEMINQVEDKARSEVKANEGNDVIYSPSNFDESAMQLRESIKRSISLNLKSVDTVTQKSLTESKITTERMISQKKYRRVEIQFFEDDVDDAENPITLENMHDTLERNLREASMSTKSYTKIMKFEIPASSMQDKVSIFSDKGTYVEKSRKAQSLEVKVKRGGQVVQRSFSVVKDSGKLVSQTFLSD